MKTSVRCLTFALLALVVSLPTGATDIKKKEEAVASIEKRKAEMIKLSDQIWAFAETALREHKSSEALADYRMNGLPLLPSSRQCILSLHERGNQG